MISIFEQKYCVNQIINSALKNRTKRARNDLLTNGKKSSRKLEKTQDCALISHC